ncbi:hypothetical protein [Pedobacter sp.]|uniref:hypothetical protein n=1 Tax=Pedobacter sp. TaxID=1411316 RepID=UPI0031DDA77A
MSLSSHFSNDIKKEQLLGVFLDELYTKLGMKFDRVLNIELQRNGIDLVVTKNEKQFLVDEKAQLDYLGKSIPTFAFEIGAFVGTEHRKGWLFDEHKETTHYMLVTDIMLKQAGQFTKPSDIASVKLLWLNRGKLLEFLTNEGLNFAYCQKEEQKARKKDLHGSIDINKEGLYFYLSTQKAEAPFNLIISRENLKKVGAELKLPF